MRIFSQLFIIISMWVTICFAQVDLEINDGLLVETTGGLSIELSGNLIENGTGYLKGVITSGDRGSVSNFAGLSITSGSVNKITRTTGTAHSAASPKTSLRSYELDNQSTFFTTDVSSEFIPGGSNDESNGIKDKFIFTKIGATWKGFSDNESTNNLITASNVNIPIGNSLIVISEGIGVGATILLEGPYIPGTIMSNTINGSIPLTSPYSEAPRTVSSVPANAVDWILVELRTGTTENTSLGYRSAFVDINGNIIDDTGAIGIGFPAVPAICRIAIKHRNHLPVLSNSELTYGWYSN